MYLLIKIIYRDVIVREDKKVPSAFDENLLYPIRGPRAYSDNVMSSSVVNADGTTAWNMQKQTIRIQNLIKTKRYVCFQIVSLMKCSA